MLSEIELRTGKPIAQSFDLVAGTSSGGIVALGLTRPGRDRMPRYSAADLVELYETEGPRIFRRPLLHSILAVGGLFEERYPDDGIEHVLREHLGEARLSDALTNVLVPCYDIERRGPFFFKSKVATSEPSRDFLMRDAARATSAAPTYFEPALVRALGGSDTFALVDGGVFANNPSMCAYVEARTLFPRGTPILLVSLGTGELTRRIPFETAAGWGIVNWAQPLMGVVFDGVSDAIDHQLLQLYRDVTEVERYFRFQVTLTDANDDLDDASPANVAALCRLGRQLVADADAELDELSRHLTEAG